MRKTSLKQLTSLLIALLSLVACGGGSNSPQTQSTISSNSQEPEPTLTVFAGKVGGPGNLDGVSDQARFSAPSSIASNGAGILYVADSENHTIRKIDSTGLVTTIAGSPGIFGFKDGKGNDARFFHPTALTVDRNGNIYVADDLNDAIRKIALDGTVSTLAGNPGETGNKDGFGRGALFNLCHQDDLGCRNSPSIVTDSKGNIFLSDYGNGLIRKITPAGEVSTLPLKRCTYPLTNNDDSTCIRMLGGLTIDRQDILYVADGAEIRKLGSNGRLTNFAGSTSYGDLDGIGENARFSNIAGLSFSGEDLVVLENNRVRLVTPARTVTTISGRFNLDGYIDGDEFEARYDMLMSGASDAAGNIFLVDSNNNCIRKITSSRVVSTFAGLGHNRLSSIFQNGAVNFAEPAGIVADANGNLYVADFDGPSIIKINASGAASAFVTRSITFDVRGTQGLAMDNNGTLYVVSPDAKQKIFKVYQDGKVQELSLVFDDPSHFSRFDLPRSIVVDAKGQFFVADSGAGIIFKSDSIGHVSRFTSLDANDPLYRPNGMVFDRDGSMLVADAWNHVIRRVFQDGKYTIIAGKVGIPGSADGDKDAARFYAPQGITLDSAGNILVADTYNHTIRKITKDGRVSTVIGVAGERGFRGGKLPGRISKPYALTFSGNTLFITANQGVVAVKNMR